MNFSGISNTGWFGQLLRWPLKLVPRRARMPILQGPLAGQRWIAGSSNHGCWLGSYEQEKVAEFSRRVQPGDVVFDIGAHVGYYTLLAAHLVGPRGRVVAFEPLPANLEILRQHLRLNKVTNVEVVAAALSDRAGTASFAVAADRSMGSLADHGELEVRVEVLDQLLASGRLPAPDCIKIDVEGAEYRLLSGARECLARHRPQLFLATHGAEVHRSCCTLLTAAGYDLQAFGDENWAMTDELMAFPQDQPQAEDRIAP